MKPRKVTASQLAELSFCEMKVRLCALHGDRDTPVSRKLRADGTKEHERFHREVLAHHNKTVYEKNRIARDRRCFIATAVYGSDDPRTEELRNFRDDRLVKAVWGRWLVSVYYAVSPPLAYLLTLAPWLRPSAMRMLDHVRRRIAPVNCKEAKAHGDERHNPQDPPAGH